MVNLPLASSSWDGDELKAIQEVISSGNFTMGSKVSEYEAQFADYFGGEEGKVKLAATQDKDIMKALTILNDPISPNIFQLPIKYFNLFVMI